MCRKGGCTTSEDAASKRKRLKEKEQDVVGSEPGCIFEWIGT